MAIIATFSIPFSSPYTLDEDIKFRAFYSGEPLRYVKKRGIYQKERKVIFDISPDVQSW